MVQFINLPQSARSRLFDSIGESLGQGLAGFTGNYFANKALDKVLSDPSLEGADQSKRMSALERALSPYGQYGQNAMQKRMQIEQQMQEERNQKIMQKKAPILAKALRNEKLTPEEESLFTPQEQLAIAKHKQSVNKPIGGLSGQAVPEEISQAIQDVVNKNQNANADQLSLAFDKAGVPRTYSNSYIENRRRFQEHQAKSEDEFSKTTRAETLPKRKELSDKAQAARQGIENKEKLLSIIDSGNLDDPTFAALAESLPLNLGKRLLSPDTVEYKAGLVDEFGDLRKIFEGQTRIKEIEILEQKLADLYLTDEQKKSILKSRLGALKADLIREEAAAELEDKPGLGVLQFSQEVEKKAKPKLDALFNHILDEQKSIINNAENRKKIALDPSDPQDIEIAQQLLKESGGDRQKARKLAKKKGYVF